MRPIFKIATLSVATLLGGCSVLESAKTAKSMGSFPRTDVNVGFYDVQARSFEELDQQIALHGPEVEGVGKAIAATNVRMVPNVRFAKIDGRCKISKSKVNVKAKVTLPRLKKDNRSNTEIKTAFGNLQNYARVHEAMHVSIADTFAQTAEKAMANLPPKPNCPALEAEAVQVFKTIMADHEEAQLEFDRQEQKRLNPFYSKS